MTWNNHDVQLLRQAQAAEQAAQPPRKQPAERVCLRCARPFRSAWCGNRLCGKCTHDLPTGSVEC